jgi:hypothetical protein
MRHQCSAKSHSFAFEQFYNFTEIINSLHTAEIFGVDKYAVVITFISIFISSLNQQDARHQTTT